MKARTALGLRSGWFVVVLVAIAAAFGLFRLLGVGESRPASSSAAALVPIAEYAERSPHVASSLNVIGIQGAVRNQSAMPAPDQPPVPAASFAAPVARYIHYSVRQLTLMQPEIVTLQRALAAGDRTAAEADWRTAWGRYLHLGGVYLEGPVAALNRSIDGSPGGLPGGTSSLRFTGLHRIEFGLWTGASPQSLVPYAKALAANVRALKALLPHTTISPLDFATRTHEILEDAVRDLLSGNDVPWSGEGVLGTQSGVVATRELLATLRPLLREPAALQADPPANPRSEAVADADLDVLQRELDSLAAGHSGQLPTNGQLSKDQAERLDGDVGQALEGLAQIPGMLETANPPATPRIPRSGIRIDQ